MAKGRAKPHTFFNPYTHNFIRVAIGIPTVKVASPSHNAEQTIDLMRLAERRGAILVVFPELGLSGYSCEDLFHQESLLAASVNALGHIVDASRTLNLAVVVGVPLQIDGLLFNCAVTIAAGRICGIAPKSYLPNYREFYELRQFTPGESTTRTSIDLLGQQSIPFGTRLVFQIEGQPSATFFTEICEDLWVPIPPSSFAALAGATVLANLSASNITIGKSEYRNELCANQSARCIAAYMYSAAGYGESTTDLAWDGHGLVYENGTRITESQRFSYEPQLVCADIDLDRLMQDRMRQNSFAASITRHRAEIERFQTIRVPISLPDDPALRLERRYERFPYVPNDPATRDARCAEICNIQTQGLVKRLRSAHMDKVVIGVSGGLDSTQALLVCAATMDVMGLPRTNILAYTMPGFATSERTFDQARRLMKAVGCTADEIDIQAACERMLKDIGHPFAKGKPVHDLTFENVQAGERTSHLFRLANLHHAIVVGTSDLSELALGWCTYGVGDHMAHYHVNASVPKTLIQHLIRFAVRTDRLGPKVSAVLKDVLTTAISPELVPGIADGQPQQATESTIGPFALQDFHLYYILRFGHRPQKVAFLAWNAWHDIKAGDWPDVPPSEHRAFDIGEIKKWLRLFCARFFQSTQFKRSAIPNAPKVGSGGSLSPRGDWRAPSDSEADAWLADVDAIPGTEPAPSRKR
jgi:NAD+ synthase (glutamine-hydrolysing)